MRSFTFFLLLLFLPFYLTAQSFFLAEPPVPAPDTPAWAAAILRGDTSLNLYALDEAFQEWEERQEAEAGDAPERENAWEAWYYRWHRAVEPYAQPGGALGPHKPSRPTPDAPAQGALWTPLGPARVYNEGSGNVFTRHANVYALDVAPSDPNIVWYGTESGMAGKSSDKGLHWTPVGLDFFNDAIGAVAIHPTQPDIVYMGIHDGVARTADGGASWQHELVVTNMVPSDIKIKPDEAEVVLAAGTSLRRRSLSGGMPLWTKIVDSRTYDLAFHPQNPAIAYALVRNDKAGTCEFWKSTDGGLTFSVRSTGWISGLSDGGGRLAVTPAAPNRIYAIALTGGGPRMLRSDDAGETWTITATGGTSSFPMKNEQGFYDLAITASHTNPDHLLVGTLNVFKSINGGSTFSHLNGFVFVLHVDVQEMITVGQDTWIATDGGITLSTDFYTAPAKAGPRTEGLTGSDFWYLSGGWNTDVLVGGRYHNGNAAWTEDYPAGSFLYIGGSESATGYVNPGNNRMVYCSDSGGRILPSNVNNPSTYFTVSKWPDETLVSGNRSEQEWDPRYFYTYYIGNGNTLWKTTDNGKTFSAAFTHGSTLAKVHQIEVSRANPNVIYITVRNSSAGELWKTTDGGATWNICTRPADLYYTTQYAFLSASGANANTLWWAFRDGPNGKKIFCSTDGGQTWINRSTARLDGVTVLGMVHQLGTDGGIYLIGDPGFIYYRNNTMPDWVPYTAGLPAAFYPYLAKLHIFYKNKKLRVASRIGVWETDLYEPSTTTLPQPMVDNPAPQCGSDTIQLESYSVVNGPATYKWLFSPQPQWVSDAKARNPRVVFGKPGEYIVRLTVTDANGTATRVMPAFVTVAHACGPYALTGAVRRSDDTSPMPGVGVQLSGTTVSQQSTNAAGQYALTALLADSLVITPAKTSDPLTDISAAAAARVRRHLSGADPLPDPYARIAADANDDHAITPADAALIEQALLSDPAARATLQPAWRFVPAAYTFPDPDAPWNYPQAIALSGLSSPLADLDFWGIRRADLAGRPGPKPETLASPAWQVRERALLAGQTETLQFSVRDFRDIAAFQFALHVDPDYLAFEKIDLLPGAVPLGLANVSLQGIASGEIRLVWSAAQGLTLPDHTPVFRLRFKVLKGKSNLSGVMRLKPLALDPIAYNTALAPAPLRLEFTDFTTFHTGADRPFASDVPELLPNQPNPFRRETLLRFRLPAGDDCPVILRLSDVQGRILWSYEGLFPPGYHERIAAPGGGSGILYCTMITPYGVLTRKMAEE